MHSAPVPADGGRDDSQPGTPPGPDQDPAGTGDVWEPVITRPDPMTEEERQAWLDALDEPFDPEEYPDPDGPPPPGEDELTAEEIAEIREATEAEARAAVNGARSGTTGALAAIAALGGRRGPGQPGSAQVFPGESASRAAAFGSGLALDAMPGGPDLAMLADAAAGDDDRYPDTSDDELIGVLCAWDRLEAHMAARKLADRPAEIPGIGPIDPALARDLAHAAAAHPRTTWCVTVTDEHGHAIGHGCARPEATSRRKRQGPAPPGGTGIRDGPGFAFTTSGQPGPPGGYGTWRLRAGAGGPRDLLVALDPISTGDCDHRFQARGHDPGVKLRHLAQVRHAACTSPVCRRPASNCDFEHNIPYEAGGRSCLCNGGPKCRHDHRLKQHPRWKVDQLPDGTFQWTTPSGRQYTTEPTRYPI